LAAVHMDDVDAWQPGREPPDVGDVAAGAGSAGERERLDLLDALPARALADAVLGPTATAERHVVAATRERRGHARRPVRVDRPAPARLQAQELPGTDR